MDDDPAFAPLLVEDSDGLLSEPEADAVCEDAPGMQNFFPEPEVDDFPRLRPCSPPRLRTIAPAELENSICALLRERWRRLPRPRCGCHKHNNIVV